MAYLHSFAPGSLRRLEGVHPDLCAVAALAITLCPYDGTIHPGGGLRTEAQAATNVANGTGILASRHRVQQDGYGHAIDLLPITPGKGVQWTNLESFRAMYKAVQDAAAQLDVVIRQGADWDSNGVFEERNEFDLAHFELPKAKYRAAAVRQLARHRALLGIDTEPDEEVVECLHCGPGPCVCGVMPSPPELLEDVEPRRGIVSSDLSTLCPHCDGLIRVVRG